MLSSPLGQDWVRCTNDDLTRGGQEIVEPTCENSYIHFNLQFVAKAALICESVKVLELRATKAFKYRPISLLSNFNIDAQCVIS